MALTNMCGILPNGFALENKFANEKLYDMIHDMPSHYVNYLTNCHWRDKTQSFSCYTRTTPILTDEGPCFTFNALNSHDMYTNE